MTLPIRLFLIFVMIAASVLMAPMRGNMAGLTQIEICADGAAAMLMVDARGNPVDAQHPCPDCLACQATGPAETAGALHFAAVILSLTRPMPPVVDAAGLTQIPATARDPPLPV